MDGNVTKPHSSKEHTFGEVPPTGVAFHDTGCVFFFSGEPAMKSKTCFKCLSTLPISDFYKHPEMRDGHLGKCKSCSKQDVAANYNAKHDQYMAYERSPQRVWRRRARVKTSDTGERWRHANMEKKRNYTRKRRAAKKMAAGANYTTKEHIKLRWEMYGNSCWICGKPATVTDHVKPISKGGAHLPCNLRPICQPCNTRKAAMWPVPSIDHFINPF